MRIPRSIQLFSDFGFVHKFWRCHNREFYLSPHHIKKLYLNCVKEALIPKICNGNVFIYAYCAMDNHFHKVMAYRNGFLWLSRFMRQAHSLFGARYNRLYRRSGKVAEGRPKTPLIEDLTHLIRVQFYVEANPIRAGLFKLENLKLYKYSSFRFYAYGIRDEFTELLTIPDWYLELGPTPMMRQKKYRALFREYIEEFGGRTEGCFKPFIGSFPWKENQLKRVRESIQQRRKMVLSETLDST